MSKVDEVVVLGGGSAGFLAAITLVTKVPGLSVRLIRSPDIGIIGVGEGTIWNMPVFLHGYLGIPPADFHAQVKPTYKLGIKFNWGPREHFFYTFDTQLDWKYDDLAMPNGFFSFEDFGTTSVSAALMAHQRAFERQTDGTPLIPTTAAYHVENKPFVQFLESVARERGVQIIEDTLTDVERGERGVEALRLASGARVTADLFVDASGFRSRLLHGVFEEPFESYASSLLCDRAVVGGWKRKGEPLLAYTTADTMDAGWSWQIEHADHINRGYVYSSAFLDEEGAEKEFRAKNPKVGEVRSLSFPSGRRRRGWVENVVGVGNAAGFVEPLEATGLMVICHTCVELVYALSDGVQSVRPAQVALFNRSIERQWESIRRFLAMHYRFNTRLDTPFWRACREDVDLAGAEEFVDYYRAVGPTLHGGRLLDAEDLFGNNGYLVMLVGQKVPFEQPKLPARHRRAWRKLVGELEQRGARAMTQEEALRSIRAPEWGWHPDFYRSQVSWR